MVEAMESIVATVSGYHGSERMKLIKLISLSGANYVGKMSRSTTHLVCWEFKGRKYELAKKFGTIILNHRWLEECVKEGKHIPEHPYTLQSGQDVGLIILDLPVLTEASSVLAENRLRLNKPNMRDLLTDVIDLDSDEIENDGWDVDFLLDENLFPKPGSRETARRRSKRRVDMETFNENQRVKASNRRSYREPQIPTVPRIQGRSDAVMSTLIDLPESSHRSRGLVRRNVTRNVIDFAFVDVEQDSGTLTNANNLTCTSSLSNNSNNIRDEFEGNIDGRPEISSTGNGRNDDEADNHLNATGTLGDTCSHGETSPDVESLNRQQTDDDVVDQCTQLPVSSDRACVICFTESSSQRGVLPCGHRFCFKCIREWADRKASERKEPKCPLCQDSFASITIVEDAASLDQKIYSQTVPNPSSTQNIYIVPEGGAGHSEFQIFRPSACCICQSEQPIEGLLHCQICRMTCIHDYCIDPPVFPWICTTCRDHRPFYHR